MLVIWGQRHFVIQIYQTSSLYCTSKTHFNYPCRFTSSVALCHLNNNRAALLQPEARLIACVMWWLLMSKAFLFYESVIRNGSVGLLEEGAAEPGCTKETGLCSIKGTECLTAGIYQFSSSVIGDHVYYMERKDWSILPGQVTWRDIQ